MQNLVMIFIFLFIRESFESFYKFLFKLFNLITFRFCFGKLVKISENASTLQSFLLTNNTEEDDMLILHLTSTGCHLAFSCYMSNLPAV